MSTLTAVDDKILVTAGNQIFTFSTVDNSCKITDVIPLASNLPAIKRPRSASDPDAEDEKENISSGKGSFQILCAALSDNKQFYAVGLASKCVIIFESSSLEVSRSFKIPKAPTSIVFDKQSEFVLVGDRAGHLCRYNVKEAINVSHKDITGELCGHEGEPLSGVISMVLDVKLSTDGKFVLFSDRDEKIRISRYPQSFVIQGFCLGHTEYVSSIAVVDEFIYSSGGDSKILKWDVNSGNKLSESARVVEKNPVKKILVVKKETSVFIYAAVENDSKLYIFEDTGSEIASRGFIQANDALVDIDVSGEYVFGVTKSSVVKFNLTNNSSETLSISEEMKNELSNSKDPIGSYYKNVTHKNLEDYQKRKAQRIESEREKKRRKKEKTRESNGSEAAVTNS